MHVKVVRFFGPPCRSIILFKIFFVYKLPVSDHQVLQYVTSNDDATQRCLACKHYGQTAHFRPHRLAPLHPAVPL